MHNFVVSQNNAISVHKIVLHSLVPIFYIYFDHTNFFIFINSYYLNLHLYFGNIFLNILVPQVRCSPRMVQVACGGTTPVVVQKGGSQLSATIERKCRLVGAEPMIGAETENENKTFGPSGLVRNRP